MNPRPMTLTTKAGARSAGAMLLAGLLAAPALAQDKQATIDDALSAAPPALADTATVSTMDGEVLREGEGDYTCFPSGGGAGPMCLDAEWMRWADAWMNKKDFQPEAVGIAYMLAGDPPEGGASNIDPFATEETADNQWVVEGPHLMMIGPGVTEGVTDDPDSGQPYVMWKGTPYAHVMVPVAPRPE
jgi:hypothetical protein